MTHHHHHHCSINRALILLHYALLAASTLAAQEPADPMDRLDQARAAYNEALDAARDRFLAAIDTRIDEAQSAGRLDAVDQFNAQKGDFLANGTIPQAPALQPLVRSYTSAQKTAGRSLVIALKAAEESLTRAGRLDEARQIQQERMELESQIAQRHPTPVAADPAERLQTNSTWRAMAQGVRVGPNGRANVSHFAIILRVTERQGDRFRALYSFEGQDKTVEVEGSLGKTTRTRQGTSRDIDFFGTKNVRGGGPLGPATTHKGLIRAGTFEVLLPPFRTGQDTIAGKALFELQPSAP